MSARKAHQHPRATGLRSKKRVRFQENQPEGGTPGAQEGERPRSEWRPDQVAVAEGAKRQRQETEDADKRESENTGGSNGSDNQPEGIEMTNSMKAGNPGLWRAQRGRANKNERYTI